MSNRVVVLFCIVFLLLIEADRENWQKLSDEISYKKELYIFENRIILLHDLKIKQNRLKIFVKSFHNLDKAKQITLKDLRVKNDYLITISGGFFSQDDYKSPQGLVIENKEKISAINKKLSGVLWIKDNYLTLSTTDEITLNNSQLENIDYAIQGYPRIVDPINKIGIKKQGRFAYRVAICTELKNNDIILFITDKRYDGITLLELAKITQSKKFNCKIAINLDGGPAPGISVSKKLINLEIKEGWQLPNAIIFQYLTQKINKKGNN